MHRATKKFQRNRNLTASAIHRTRKALWARRLMATISSMADVAIEQYHPSSPSEARDRDAWKAVDLMTGVMTCASDAVLALEGTEAMSHRLTIEHFSSLEFWREWQDMQRIQTLRTSVRGPQI